MTILESIVLGIVQGITEFLPISSTAHLRVVPALLGWSDPGAAYSAIIQLGTVLAVLIYFREDLTAVAHGVTRGLLTGRLLDDPGGRQGVLLLVGTVPIVVFGLAGETWIKGTLRGLDVIAAALIGVGLIMALAEYVSSRQPPRMENEPPRLGDAIVVGLAQACALIPGVSRAGSTIAAGLFRGLSRRQAARFSFLLSVPAITAAGVKEAYEVMSAGVAGVQPVPLLVGSLVSFVVGYATIAGLLSFLARRSVMIFVFYRIALGVVLLGLLGMEVLRIEG